MTASKGSGMFGAGTAALRKIVSNPLTRGKGANSGTPLDSGAASGHSALSDDSINSIIENDIIPRLMMAHSMGGPAGSKKGTSGIAPSDANRFALLPLRMEAANLMDEVDAFLAEGVSVEAIYIDLLAPAARRLGEMWNNDECDFVDVTMGLWRLQEVMRDIADRAPGQRKQISQQAPRALFAPMPGDTHSFGAQMIDEIFARSGWNSTVITKPLRKELLDIVSKEPFDLLGLTVSRDCPSSALQNLIKAVRGVSANPHLSILIGGHMINQNPALVAEVGADGTGADARAALNVAERLVQSAEVRAHMLR